MGKCFRQLVFVISLFHLLGFAAVGNATVLYSYKGNPFDNVAGPHYTTDERVEGFFAVSERLAPNLDTVDISKLVMDFGFSDGVQELTAASRPRTMEFLISTNSLGDISLWSIKLALGTPTERNAIRTHNMLGLGYARDSGRHGLRGTETRGILRDNPGVFTTNLHSPNLQSATPLSQPPSLLLGAVAFALWGAWSRLARRFRPLGALHFQH